MEDATIPEFYANKNVLLTGATGFIGKVFVEKLLRSCPDVKGIYCLVRPKKGLTGEDRLDKLLEDRLFDRVRNVQPGFEQKVHAIEGDCMEEELGIKESDVEILNSQINIVFHSAATVKFNEHLRIALNMNVLGVRRMIKLARGFKHLEVFVHISTAFSNCERYHIEERIYPSPIEPQKLIDALEWMDDEMITAITPKLIGEKPNTYTYTKQLAETLLIQEGGDLPLAIVRPSIVTAAWREPYPGWIDNINGVSGICIAIGKGYLRSCNAGPGFKTDWIPVDLSVNTMLVVAWYTVVKKQEQNAKVYHTISRNQLEWGMMKDMLISLLEIVPYENSLRRPKCHITIVEWVHNLHIFFSHTLVAYLCDKICVLLGKKPRMMYMYSKLQKSMEALHFFGVRYWDWTHTQVDTLKNAMKPEDAEHFYIDPMLIDWRSYFEHYILGTKKYILKEDVMNIPAAKAHLRRLRNISYAFNTMVVILLWRFLVTKSAIASKSWHFTMGLIFKFMQKFKVTSSK